MDILNTIKCKLLNHIDGRKVSCPFTLKTYIHCQRCDVIIRAEDNKE
jgi:hypothetical protein